MTRGECILKRSAIGLACVVALLGQPVGCGGDDDAAGPAPLDVDNVKVPPKLPGTSGDDDDDGSGSGSAGSGSGTGSGSDPGLGPNADGVCKHVDLVIAVDGSSSMDEEKQAMREIVFPAFAQRLRQLGAGLDDFRVATIDACPMPPTFHTQGNGGQCNFEGGNPWIESSSSALEAEFACVGDLYLGDIQCTTENDDEQPATSAVDAIAATPGFRRDDALLIVIAITDEDEQPTTGDPSMETLYANLAAAAGSDPRRMVFVGVGGREACDEGEGAYGGAEEADDLRALTDLFGAHNRGVFWDLCEGRLEDGLDQAFQVIEAACEGLCDGLDEDCGAPPDRFCLEIPDDPACRVD